MCIGMHQAHILDEVSLFLISPRSALVAFVVQEVEGGIVALVDIGTPAIFVNSDHEQSKAERLPIQLQLLGV